MVAKRLFDILFSFLALLVIGWFLLIVYVLASIDVKSSGLFTQKRIGRHGKPFTIFKIKTLSPGDGSISSFGRQLRNFKIDELPQLLNVLIGDMSLVGPRPDVPGYYDCLQGEERKLLELRPGITGPASLKYANEEELLSLQADPQKYNDEVIFPDKVRINLTYYKKQNFWLDLKIMLFTLLGKRDVRL